MNSTVGSDSDMDVALFTLPMGRRWNGEGTTESSPLGHALR